MIARSGFPRFGFHTEQFKTIIMDGEYSQKAQRRKIFNKNWLNVLIFHFHKNSNITYDKDVL